MLAAFRHLLSRWRLAFTNLRVSQKLALIGIFFIIPDSVMLYLFIAAINANIDFAVQEKRGNEYQRPLERLLELLPQHRLLVRHVLDGEPEYEPDRRQTEQEIERALAALEAVDAKLGVALQFTEEGLAKRQRQQHRPRLLHQRWEALQADLSTLPLAERRRRYDELIASLRIMITHAGDLSNLILDPDLDSYYVMDATLLALPQAQDRLAAIMLKGDVLLKQTGIDEAERRQLAIYASLLQESDLDRVKRSLETALNEDRNFYGVSKTLQERIPPLLKKYIEANSSFIELNHQLASSERTTVSPKDYVAAGSAARETSFTLWRTAVDEFDRLLDTRIASYRSRRARSLLVAGFALLAAVGFVTFITKSISGPLRRQTAELVAVNESLEAEIAERTRAEEELRQNEAQLAAAQKVAGIGSWEWSLEENAMTWSEENFRIHGVTPQDYVPTYRSALDFVRFADRLRSSEFFQEAIESGRPFSFEQRILRRDGSERIVHQRGEVVRGANGKVVRILGTAQDVTERKQAEEELERVNRELVQASRQAGMAEVATGVLHNVGNVLNSVNVSTNVIYERLKKSRITHVGKVSAMLKEHEALLGEFFQTHPKGKMLPGFIHSLGERLEVEQSELLQEVDSLLRNIGHIKDIVSVQQNYAAVSGVLENLSALSLVQDALQMNASAIERHGIHLIKEYAEVAPVQVDKHKVLQILINLIRNAKYAMDGQSTKRLVVRVHPKGLQRVIIAVEDNGVGIPAEHLDRVFAFGFTTKVDGHGFGLHSSAIAAKEMGGALKAYSAGPGTGATFALELPVAPSALVDENEALAAANLI